MKILLGECRGKEQVSALQRLGWGRMYVNCPPRPFEGESWGFDNGAFVAWRNGQPFPTTRYQRRLDHALSAGAPYIAIAPDIVAGGVRSLAFSLEWLPQLPSSWPWYLAAQDGMTPSDVAPVLDRFAGLFLGGTDRFKATEAERWSDLAHGAGKRFHYGRAGTINKVDHATRVGADSIDSAFPLWTRERFARFERHITHQRPQTTFQWS